MFKIFGVMLAILFVAATARAEQRIALVIGLGAYQTAPQLPNPANDARNCRSFSSSEFQG